MEAVRDRTLLVQPGTVAQAVGLVHLAALPVRVQQIKDLTVG